MLIGKFQLLTPKMRTLRAVKDSTKPTLFKSLPNSIFFIYWIISHKALNKRGSEIITQK